MPPMMIPSNVYLRTPPEVKTLKTVQMGSLYQSQSSIFLQVLVFHVGMASCVGRSGSRRVVTTSKALDESGLRHWLYERGLNCCSSKTVQHSVRDEKEMNEGIDDASSQPEPLVLNFRRGNGRTGRIVTCHYHRVNTSLHCATNSHFVNNTLGFLSLGILQEQMQSSYIQ